MKRSDTVTAHLQTIAQDCDLIVGTEEELHILGGAQDTLEALRRIRALTRATLVATARERFSWEGVAGGVIAAAQGRLSQLPPVA